MDYKGSSNNRNVPMMCRLTSIPNLLNSAAGSLPTLGNNLELPATFMRSSRIHIDDIKETGRRVIAVVQNLTNRGVLVFLRYIYSVNGVV